MTQTVPQGPRERAGYYLFVLFLANLLNMADRSLLGIVVDPVRSDLHLSDTQMSLVSGSAFVLFNLAAGLFIARWVDRGNRKLILVLGLTLWTGGTALTGLAQGFASLALTRVLVGAGEAAAFPVAISMIADLFASGQRPRAISIFQSSGLVGIVSGSILAGTLAAAQGWRAMFILCGLAGCLLVVLLIVTVREPARVVESTESVLPASGTLQTAARLMRMPGFSALALGAAFGSMAVSVLPVWAPAFLLRSHHVALASVGALIGPAVGIGGVSGSIMGGLIASRLVLRRGGDVHGLLVPMIAVPLATPFFLVFIFLPSLTLAMTAAAVMNFLIAMAAGPCVAVAIAMVPSTQRAVSSTCMLIVSGVIGGAVAPLIVGAVSDGLREATGVDSLRYGLATMAPTPLVAGWLLWLAYSRIGDRSQTGAAARNVAQSSIEMGSSIDEGPQ